MVLYPEKQRLVRNEIDTVIGNRLPLVSDMPDLPYVCAAIKESMRWQPLAPLCTFNLLPILMSLCLNASQLLLEEPPKMISTRDILYQRGQYLFRTFGELFSPY